jgi:DNA-binding MarR family transcriptional regulator
VTEDHKEFTSFNDISAHVERTARVLVGVWSSAQERTTDRVSLSQLRALEAIGPATVNLRTLADRLDMIPSSASRLCDRLQAAGLLDRTGSDQDRRQIGLRLTRPGMRLLGELSAHRRRDLDEILRRMTPRGRRALLHGLQEFTDAMTGRA